MSMADTIADMLTRIRNGQKSRLINVSVAFSNLKLAILKVLQNEGYIKAYEEVEIEGKKYLDIALKYSANGNPVVREIHRVSKPSKRIYSPIKNLKGYYNNMGIYILSTSRGVISDREAHHLKVGGEVICKVF